jgi:hypothetical protein
MSDQPQANAGAEALEKLTAFVTEQAQSGADKGTIKTRLMAGGIQEEIATELVERVFADVVVEEEFSLGSLLPAMVGGVIGAVIGGVVWGLIATATGYEIGWIAWGVGWLAGVGVVLFAGGRRGRPLQLVAVAAAVLGLLIGKYFTFVAALKQYLGEELGVEAVAEMSMFSVGVIQMFGASLTVMVNGFDLLWIFLAVATAWGIPKVRELQPETA